VPAVAIRRRGGSREERFATCLEQVYGQLVDVAAVAPRLVDLGVTSAVVETELVPLPPGIDHLPADRVWEADAAICEARAGFAATGGVLVAAPDNGGRLSSLVPPVTVLALPRSRLWEVPGDALRRLDRLFTTLPTCVTIITGPSRSADICGRLTLGVHGPTTVLVALVDELPTSRSLLRTGQSSRASGPG
jgi:L-lactate utilization protein LutC